MTRRMKILIAITASLGALSLALAIVMINLQEKIDQRLEKGWVLPPLEIYSQGLPLSPGRRIPLDAIQQELNARDFNSGRDFEYLNADGCSEVTGIQFRETSQRCLFLRRQRLVITWDENGFIQELWRGDPWASVASHSLFPKLVTQFYNGQPILQVNAGIAQIPLYCLQATTAIEDRDFLEHRGVSATGTMRAIVRNLRKGRFAEGGSTITQQLVKNFFLTSQKTIRRKLQEQFLAIMLESQITKDQILEMYLNVIYMGQSGPYQVLGFASASQHYFNKPVEKLGLAECAMLGAIINSAGRYSPFTQPEAARTRRELVLSKMVEEGMITPAEMKEANEERLPVAAQQKRTHAPYFVMTALKEFQALDISSESGARLYTTLDPEAQALMLAATGKVMPAVEAKVKKPSKQPLQVAAITVDLATAQVIALTGGRDFKATQYNRASDSRRQIGSIVKPFVFLPALNEKDALTSVVDEPFEWKVGKNVWKPRNYDGKTRGPVPYFYALAHSLNIPAAKVGKEVGLDNIADVIAESGIRTPVPRLPSLTLGAFELSLWEVAQGYTTIGRFGIGDRIHTLMRVEDIQGEVLFERESENEVQLDPRATAVLVGMMRASIDAGSARAARAWGLEGPFAGKTGTTSDTKDAWFGGFNSRFLTVVWVGYDDNTAMGLTGASAALPVWTEISKSYQVLAPPSEFAWPEGIETRKIEASDLTDDFPQLTDLPSEIDLTFADWAY